MAIKKCFECGKDVSSNAPACPHCGAKRSSNFSVLRVLLMVFSILVLLPLAVMFGGVIGFFAWLVWIIILLVAK